MDREGYRWSFRQDVRELWDWFNVAENLKLFRLIVKYSDGTVTEVRGDFSKGYETLKSIIESPFGAYVRNVLFYEDE